MNWKEPCPYYTTKLYFVLTENVLNKMIFYTTEKVLVEVFTPDSNIDQPRTVFMEPYMLNGRKILLGVYFDRLYVNLNPAQN